MKRIALVSATFLTFSVQMVWAATPPAASAPATSPSASSPATPSSAPAQLSTTPSMVVPPTTANAANESTTDASQTPTKEPIVAPVAVPAEPTKARGLNTTQPTSASTSTTVEPSPYGPSAAERNQQRNRERVEKDRDVPATLVDGHGDYAFGGMGGVGVMYTRIAGKNAPLVCGEGAVIIDHALTLGGGGCGLPRLLKARDYSFADYDADDRMTFGYGGAIIRYHFRSRQLVNYSVGALVGAGGLTTGSWSKKDGDWENNFKDQRNDAVFVFEPQAGAHINITRWLRAGAVVGYRLVSGVDTKGLSSSQLSGVTAGGQLQAGWF